MSPRSRGGGLRELWNASWAAPSAASAASAVASAPSAIVSPVAGSSTGIVPPPPASRHRPPMYSCVLTPSRTACSADAVVMPSNLPLARAPVGAPGAVDHEVHVAQPVPLPAAPDALLAEPQALRHRAAAPVGERRGDLDALEPPGAERVLHEHPHGLRHRAAALVLRRQPVADAARRARPVDAVEADDPGDLALDDDRGLDPVVVGDLAPGRADEREDLRRAARRAHPRHPRVQVSAVTVDQREQLLRVALLEEAQMRAAGQVAAEH